MQCNVVLRTSLLLKVSHSSEKCEASNQKAPRDEIDK